MIDRSRFDGRREVFVPLIGAPVAALAAVFCLGVALSGPSSAAAVEGEWSGTVELRAEDAPLVSVLEYLAGMNGMEARVGGDIRDHVSGRLAGEIDELIELLVDTHGLSVFRDDSTVWFDREGRRVVDFVRLDESELERARTALSRPPAVGGNAVADASGRGLVLSGTRAYVQSSLERIALATRASGVEERGTDGDTIPDLAAALTATEPTSASSPPIAAAPSAIPRPSRIGRRLSLDEPNTSEVLGARIALVSSREPHAVALEDGTWFVPGDTLPNGHRIVTIERDELLLERNGIGTLVALP